MSIARLPDRLLIGATTYGTTSLRRLLTGWSVRRLAGRPRGNILSRRLSRSPAGRVLPTADRPDFALAAGLPVDMARQADTDQALIERLVGPGLTYPDGVYPEMERSARRRRKDHRPPSKWETSRTSNRWPDFPWSLLRKSWPTTGAGASPDHLPRGSSALSGGWSPDVASGTRPSRRSRICSRIPGPRRGRSVLYGCVDAEPLRAALGQGRADRRTRDRDGYGHRSPAGCAGSPGVEIRHEDALSAEIDPQDFIVTCFTMQIVHRSQRQPLSTGSAWR